MQHPLIDAIQKIQALGITELVDFDRFYLYSLVAHSTAIEGSTLSEVEVQVLLEDGTPAAGRHMVEQMMNIDLKEAYDLGRQWALKPCDITPELLRGLNAKVMRRTGGRYSCMAGDFDSSKGDFRRVNVQAGFNGPSYLSYNKVPDHVEAFCQWLNAERHRGERNDIVGSYRLSFEAHLRLVSIHPWVDGNGRTTRLLMNMLQWERNLLPVIIEKGDKAPYIQALSDAQGQEDAQPFVDFMFDNHLQHLLQLIARHTPKEEE